MNHPEQHLPFWETKKFAQMSPDEWESLCDGCGKCCLHKLEDEETAEVFYTGIACRYLDDSCRCKEYQHRADLVPECITLKPDDVAEFTWLPSSCAYRLIAEAKPLPHWHPLVSGDAEAIHKAGESVQGRVLSEEFIHPDEFEEQIINWVE